MSALFIPTLSHWLHLNCWSGSLGRASYYVTPRVLEGQEDVPAEDRAVELFVEAWTGPLCYELSTAERTAVFPASETGLEDMRLWLEQNLSELDAAARGTETA